MLYWEQIALLYVVSTIAMCTLFLVVAFSNLEKDEQLSPVKSEEGAVNVAKAQDLASQQKRAA